MRLHIDCTSTDPEIIRLCSQYWELDKEGQFVYRVKDLVLPEGINSKSLYKTIAELSICTAPDYTCKICERVKVFTSRADYLQARMRQRAWTCDECTAALVEGRSDIGTPEELRRQKILESYGDIEPTIFSPTDELSFSEAAAIVALVRATGREDLNALEPVGGDSGRFSPTQQMDARLLRHLYRACLIAVDPNSSLAAFAEDIGTFYLLQVGWIPPTSADGDTALLLNELEQILRGDEWPESWHEDCVKLWKEIALAECIQYLLVKLDEHGMRFSPGEKTEQVFQSLLNDFSAAQMYVFIWRAVKDSAAYLARGSVHRQQAANSTISRIQRTAERALAEGWEVKPYGRDWRAPETELAHVVYHIALRLGSSGLSCIPGHTQRVGAEDDQTPETQDAEEEQ